jgi:hypothetical protein
MTAPDGKDLSETADSVTLSKARRDICMDAAYELDAIAAMLPSAVEKSDEVAMASHLRVRCMAARVQALAIVLMSGLLDEAVTTQELQSKVIVS